MTVSKEYIKDSLRHISECETCTAEVQENAMKVHENLLELIESIKEVSEGGKCVFDIPSSDDLETICALISYLNHVGNPNRTCTAFLEASVRNMLISTVDRGLPKA